MVKRKRPYHYTIDLRNNTITLPTYGKVSDGLISKHRAFYGSIKEYWEFFDYSVNQITVIDVSGKKRVYESTPFNIDYTQPKSWAIVPTEAAGRIAAGESAYDWSASVKEGGGKTYGGINFTSTLAWPNLGGDNKYNKSGNGTSVNIDDLFSVLGIGGAAFSTGPISDFPTLIRYLNDVGQAEENARTLAPITIDNTPPKFEMCSGCNQFRTADEKKNIKDTTNKGIRVDNTKTIRYEKFHK